MSSYNKQMLAAQVTETIHAYVGEEVHLHMMKVSDVEVEATLSEAQKVQMKHLAQQFARQVDKIVDKRRTFSCTECSKTFPQKWGLTRHMRTHTGWKPHSCGICAKSFTQLCALRRHEQIHDDALRWKCDVCDKNFKLKEYLHVHVQKVHGDL